MSAFDDDSDGSSPAAVVNERVYVAVGREVQESKLTLQWALENFGGHFRILYVHSPAQTNPAGRQLYGGGARISEEIESENVNKILDEYVHMCNLAKVPVEKRWIEERDTSKGIVELIEVHAVTKLVMGAAADKYYTQGMTELQSSKARFIEQHAHPSCSIWFICKGHLIHLREGDLSTVDMDVVGSSWLPAQSTVETKQSNPASPSLGSLNSLSCPSEVDDDQPLIRRERGEGSSHRTESSLLPSYEEDRQYAALLNVLDGSNNNDLYEQLEKAMAEAANAKREAFEELVRRQKAEKNAIEATRIAKTLENLYSEEHWRRKEVEEILATEKEDQRVLLESQIAGSDHIMQELRDKLVTSEQLVEIYKKERDELQVQFENALKVNEDLLTNQSVEGEPSASSSHGQQQTLMEFSFSDVQEATDSFNPALKIEEGDYGSMYKGSIHYTSVSIKMLQSPSHYHQEVQVGSRLRHPNLVNLIGVCPDACALIYEHLPNGNLEDRLSSSDSAPPLLWKNRIGICSEICGALIFLYSCNPRGIVHGDLKPRNVLLDANFVSKLGGFGIHGTELLSVESDVFSFGTILMQLLTGKSEPDLATEVQDAVNEGSINAMLDPTAGEWPSVEATQLVHLALSCCDRDRSNRPDLISEVWAVLESVTASCEEVSSSSNHINSNEPPDQPPSHFVCPILQEVMEDPVVAADGFTYDAEAIQDWFNNDHNTSPMTNLQLAHNNLLPNQTLRSAIQEWLQQHQNHYNPPPSLLHSRGTTDHLSF